tara:strand:+ start:530 stop:1594 length:1065 start_codon:yes stop_codon:yes gene_type:complete
MIKLQQLLYQLILIFFISCSTSPPISTQSTTNKISILTFSEDGFSATITIPSGPNSLENALHQLMKHDNTIAIDQYLNGVVENSIISETKDAIISSLPKDALDYRIKSFSTIDNSSIIHLELNRKQIESTIYRILKKYNSSEMIPILPLFSISKTPPKLQDLNNIKLLIPCLDAKVPVQQLLLPNAPRAYRHGTHRGIDFYVNWGTSVRSVADGVVIRAEHEYHEMEFGFRTDVLNDTKILGRTPSDVFEHLLLGQAVYIDHGFDLISGFRAVSIYAHLSHINSNITIGSKISRGQEIGKSGNTGTEDSTLKKKTGSHLHWEMILQNQSGEYYLGQGEKYDSLYLFLSSLFVDD